MRRPLSVFGFSFIIFTLSAIFVPQQVLLPIAVFFWCAIYVVIFQKKYVKYKVPVAIILAALVFASIYFYWYNKNITNLITGLENQTVNVKANVVDVISYKYDSTSVIVKVLQIDNEKVASPFKAQIFSVPSAEKGDNISLNVKFDKVKKNKYLFSNYAKAIFLSANYTDNFKLIDNTTNVVLFFDKLQNKLSANIKNSMWEQTGGVAAAMAVGEKSSLSAEISSKYRAAGISHMLVVSGMHLSAISGIVYFVLRKTLKGKRICSALSIVFIFLFSLLTGITPSILRAGTVLTFVYLAMIFMQNSDTLTSVSFAGIIICLQNPYCAIDIGFLLSFTATIGIICSIKFMSKLLETDFFEKRKKLVNIIKAISVPAATTLATLPVLIGFGVPISLVSVLVNIIAVPVLPIIVACSFVIAVFANVQIFSWIVSISAFLCNILISYLNIISSFFASIPFSNICITGLSALVMVLILYLLIYVSFKFKVKNKIIFLAFYVLAFVILQSFIYKDIVTIDAVSSALNTPIIITQNSSCVVVFTGQINNIKYVEDYLKQANIRQIDYFFDMRKNIKAPIVPDEFLIENYVEIYKESKYGDIFRINDDIIIMSLMQENASAIIVDVYGYKTAINNGVFDYAQVGPVNILFAGQSKVENLTATHIISSVTPSWIDNATFDEHIISPFTKVRIRPEKSARIYEEFYGYN